MAKCEKTGKIPAENPWFKQYIENPDERGGFDGKGVDKGRHPSQFANEKRALAAEQELNDWLGGK